MLQLAAKLQGQGLTGPQVRPFLLDAISVYCPDADELIVATTPAVRTDVTTVA